MVFGSWSRESEHGGGVAVEDFFRVPWFQSGIADVLNGVIVKLSAFVRIIRAEANAVGAHRIHGGSERRRMSVAHAAIPHALGGDRRQLRQGMLPLGNIVEALKYHGDHPAQMRIDDFQFW